MTHPILLSDQWFLQPGTKQQAMDALGQKRRAVMGLHCCLPGLTDAHQDLSLSHHLGHNLSHLAHIPLRPVVAHVTGDVSRPEQTSAWLEQVARQLAGRVSMVELSLAGTGTYDKPSAARADVRAGDILRTSVEYFEAAGLMLALRHAHGHWLEKIQDSVRVLMRVNHPNIGVVLSLPDWAASDGTRLEDRLHLALPRLMNVIVDGRRAGGEYPGARGVMEKLAGLGYIGPVTLTPGEAGETLGLELL